MPPGVEYFCIMSALGNAVEIPPSMAVTVSLGSISLNIPGFGTSEWGEDKWGQ